MDLTQIEVASRDCFKHIIQIEETGKILEWSFQTKKYSIGFGLFRLSTETLKTAEILKPIDATQTHSSKPPKFEEKIESITIEPNVDSPAFSRPKTIVENSNFAQSSTIKKSSVEDSRKRLTFRGLKDKLVSPISDLSGPETVRGSFGSSTKAERIKNLFRKDKTSLNNHFDLQDNYIQILPIIRYNSDQVAVKGDHLVTVPGTYILYFDNSFSRSRSKQLTFFVAVNDKKELTAKPQLNGWLLKKKRRKNQGWAKRWVVLTKGILSYYLDPSGMCRGSVSVASAVVSVIAEKRIIVLDSGSMIYYFQALDKSDLQKWTDAIYSYKTKVEITNETRVVSGDDNMKNKKDSIWRQLTEIGKEIEKCDESSLVPNTNSLSGSSFAKKSGILNRIAHRPTSAIEERKQSIPSPINAVQNSQNHNPADILKSLEKIHQLLCQCATDIFELSESNGLTVSSTSYQSSMVSSMNLGSRAFRDDSSIYFDANADLNSPLNDLNIEDDSSDESSSDEDGFVNIGRNMSLLTLPHKIINVTNETVTENLNHHLDSDESEDGEVYESAGDEDVKAPRTPNVAESNFLYQSSISTEPQIQMLPVIPPQKFRLSLPILVSPSSTATALLTVLRKNIGKDLSTIAMPIILNEPLSALQRACEGLEYSSLLDTANSCLSSTETMQYVAAFAISGYASTATRSSRKPFNPLLGETYECVRQDRNFRFIAEKVKHNPVVIASHAESDNYVYWEDLQTKSKFWGKSIELIPLGRNFLKLKKTGHQYIWNKVNSHVSVLGGNSIEHFGEMKIQNVTTGDSCCINFKEAGYFSSKKNVVEGNISNAAGELCFKISGTWSEAIYLELPDDKLQLLWKCTPLPTNSQQQYGFTQFAIELNDLITPQPDYPYKPISKTDSRNRKDIRLYEEGNIAEAEKEKDRIEQLQRERRKKPLFEGEDPNIESDRNTSSKYFQPVLDDEGNERYVYKDNYWDREEDLVNALW